MTIATRRITTLPKEETTLNIDVRNIGITGFMSVKELITIQERFHQLALAHPHTNGVEPRLMAGILVSSKTIKGILNKYPGRYPKPEKLAELFQAANLYNTLNLAHFNTDDRENLVAQCEEVIQVAGPSMHGFQLNLHWPDPVQIIELKQRHPDLHILLQIGGRALQDFAIEHSQYDVDGFLAKIASYEGHLSEILLDPSGGKGQPMQSERLVPLVQALTSISGLGIGAAGGLSAETINLITPLKPHCSYLSVDVEGRVRNPEDDSLNIEKAIAYLEAAFKFFYA